MKNSVELAGEYGQAKRAYERELGQQWRKDELGCRSCLLAYTPPAAPTSYHPLRVNVVRGTDHGRGVATSSRGECGGFAPRDGAEIGLLSPHLHPS